MSNIIILVGIAIAIKGIKTDDTTLIYLGLLINVIYFILVNSKLSQHEIKEEEE